jgi:hypothetical protein
MLSIALLIAAFGAGILLLAATESTRFDGVPRSELASAAVQVLVDTAAENPHFDPNPPSGAVPICPGAAESSIKPLRLGFGLMRGSEEGLRLYEVLVDHDVCISVEDLSFAAAYAQSRWSSVTGWVESTIVIDRSLVRSGGAAKLAAVMVHEATHVDRMISGQSCQLSDDCKLLSNGVPIDEEIAAHTAEAEWWIEAFGQDGRDMAFDSGDLGENAIADAYLDGRMAFRVYITRIRSDPREGDDF